MKVEVKDGIPLTTKSVADLRKLPDWSSDWSLVIPLGRDPWNTVRVAHRTVRPVEFRGFDCFLKAAPGDSAAVSRLGGKCKSPILKM